MSDFLAKTIKDQTDSILRKMKNAPASAATVRGGTTTPGTGPGTTPEVVEPNRDLDRHKSSGDHDGRYYTEGEVDDMLNFVSLTDTPDAYLDQAGKLAAVNAAEDGMEFVPAPPAENGIPTGGTNNQLLAKDGTSDYVVKWMDVPEAVNGLPEGGTSGQVLEKIDSTDYNAQWVDVDARKILAKSVSVADFTGKDGYVLAYDEVAGEFYLKADDGGGGGSEFAFLTLTDKQFLVWEDYAISTIAEPE